MAVSFGTHVSLPRQTLASAQLPRRVRRSLEQLYALVSDEMARSLERMLGEFEQQLFRQADQASNPGLQQSYFETLRLVRQNRADLIPQFLSGLETALASIRMPVTAQPEEGAHLHFGELRLVEEHELDEGSLLRAIAARHEARCSLPLHLLGQRFGVLAGAPAFDSESVPVGPQALGRILGQASHVLQLDLQPRLDLFRVFDTHALNGYSQLAEAMNATLARENVLPNLAYVPIRIRPTLQSELTGEAGRERREKGYAPPVIPLTPIAGGRPHTGWFGGSEPDDEVPAGNDAGPGGYAGSDGGGGDGGARGGGGGYAGPTPADGEAFAVLQQMLASRRDLLGKLGPNRRKPSPIERAQLSTEDVMQALARLQTMARDSGGAAGLARKPRTVHDVRQALLAQTRQLRGEAAALSNDDSDAFELLSILLAEIQRELRQDAPSNRLLHELVVPLLRLVLKDRGFFVQTQHPARQLLNAVAESGASWMSEEESDPALNDQLQHAVEDVVANFEGDTNVFEAANARIQQHLQSMARRAEVTERRHVDAARGKEKLELAKRRATELIEETSRNQNLPRFVRTLLANSWTDVLTLTQLRSGEDSEEWTQQVEDTRAIVQATNLDDAVPPAQGLAGRIERSLAFVGYHQEEAGDIARRLTARVDEEAADPASRTELAMKLKSRGRLGQEAVPDKLDLPPRSPIEQAAYEHLRTLPFGTWFEFNINQQGDVARRRLSWYSPLTDHALFVNQRGQRVGEQSLDSLARMLAQNQARVVTADDSGLVDRAWHTALGALRNFARNEPHDEAGE
jgi:hypothetical protein